MIGHDDPFIGPEIGRRIENELTAIEREQGVSILFAVESGSRAWRFPSRDSDYDVRFIYVEPIERYLTVFPRRDVIERPIDETLDISGWDLRKALRLLTRSNAVLLEWLTSPVRYRERGMAPARILDLARSTMDLTTLAYHYDRQARRGFEEISASDNAVGLKTYCYTLRTALALRWIRERRAPPPMDLPALLLGLPLPNDIDVATADLCARKSAGTEGDTTPRIAVLDAMIAELLADKIAKIEGNDRGLVAAQADRLFATIVLEASSGNP